MLVQHKGLDAVCDVAPPRGFAAVRLVARPTMTCAICTLGRPEGAAIAVASVLTNDHPDFEVIVIDQNSDDETEKAILTRNPDPRVRIIRTNVRGLNNARNRALLEAKSNIVAFTDDDCEVPSNWLRTMEDAFASDDQIGMVYSRVQAGTYNQSEGFVPICDDRNTRTVTRPWQFASIRGMGAGMAVRKQVINDLGGFDPLLDVGTKFPSYGDVGIGFRVLAEGQHVHYCSDVVVTHHGFRTWREFSVMTHRTFIGIGAGHSKFIRYRPLLGLYLMVHDLHLHVLSPIVAYSIRLKLPPVKGRVTGWWKGFLWGLRVPVNKNGCFVERRGGNVK